MTVTIPRAMQLETKTPVSLREGRYDGQVVYLKAVPLPAALDGLPGTQYDAETVDGKTIEEDEIDVYTVRGGESETKSLTIPARCNTRHFERQSKPMVVGGRAEEQVVYVKLIPESLYETTGSITLTEIVQSLTKTGPDL